MHCDAGLRVNAEKHGGFIWGCQPGRDSYAWLDRGSGHDHSPPETRSAVAVIALGRQLAQPAEARAVGRTDHIEKAGRLSPKPEADISSKRER
jgi:hypothetical protein